MPQMMLMSVVFPAPFGPSRAKISPWRISRFTFFRASKPEAYVLPRPDTVRMGAPDPFPVRGECIARDIAARGSGVNPRLYGAAGPHQIAVGPASSDFGI